MKVLKHLSAGLVTVATMLSLAQGSAIAAKPTISPQAVNSTKPCWVAESGAGSVTVYIGESNHCISSTSSQYYMGMVEVSSSSTYWHIEVTDGNCDSIGDIWHAHAEDGTTFNFGDETGCADGGQPYNIGKSVLAPTSVNWWVTWGGWTSPAFAFPS